MKMSFRFNNTHKRNYKNDQKQKRKEKDSFLTHLSQINVISLSKRASSFTSEGSVTVEAALVVPIFFFAVLSLVYLLEIMNVQTVMRSALHCAAKEIAEEAYVNPLLIRGKLEKHIVEHVGETWLDHSVISGGSDGIDCRKSMAWGSTGIMDLSLIYKVEVPILTFRIPAIVQEESMRVKGWNGYAGNGFGNQSDETVYITDTGIVYHKDADCTYLELSIKSVAISDVEQLRNESGGKYYPCESCMRKTFGKQMVYITDTGNRYHGSLSCSRLKQTVYAVPLSEVFGRGGCKRCVK